MLRSGLRDAFGFVQRLQQAWHKLADKLLRKEGGVGGRERTIGERGHATDAGGSQADVLARVADRRPRRPRHLLHTAQRSAQRRQQRRHQRLHAARHDARKLGLHRFQLDARVKLWLDHTTHALCNSCRSRCTMSVRGNNNNNNNSLNVHALAHATR
jgi:hypothetical protein